MHCIDTFSTRMPMREGRWDLRDRWDRLNRWKRRRQQGSKVELRGGESKQSLDSGKNVAQ
uniref:HDC05188 n=1 Tax=Drosophila melanogaster TaxID=7227 RepID=Q6IGU2_DROME|nr:TPA_inf: HDC05188 [Drosophila melanogaster]